MRHRIAPRSIASAIDALTEDVVPESPIVLVQREWAGVAGELIAAQCEPVSERDGVVTVTCSSAVWAQELDLLAAELIGRLNAALGTPLVTALRCRAAPARRWPGRDG